MHKKINYYFKAYEQSCSIVCARGGGGGSDSSKISYQAEKRGGANSKIMQIVIPGGRGGVCGDPTS